MAFAGVVPAAGASRRMGANKAQLLIGGETFLMRVVRALLEGTCDPVYVVVARGDRGSARIARDAGAEVLENPDPGEGPITSLRIALAEVDESREGIVYLPLDHPLVGAGTVAALLAAAAATAAPLTIPVFDGKRGHPAIFRRTLFGELTDPALEGGARTVVHRHLEAANLVSMVDRAVVTDIDTPDAYAAAIEHFAASIRP